jgi:two-component system, NtrC family, response regulator AlgB
MRCSSGTSRPRVMPARKPERLVATHEPHGMRRRSSARWVESATETAMPAVPCGQPAGAGLEPWLALLESRASAMHRAIAVARQAAVSDVPVLLIGEIGTGKSALAAAIHAWSRRRDGSFVTVSCTALSREPPSNGRNVRGAAFFTRGSHAFRQLQAASGGTLFLDEIADLSPELQFELLQLLGDPHAPRIEGGRPPELDGRIVAGSHRDLEAEVRAGRFRDDLFFRLSVVTIVLPPLRERPEDLALLVDRLLEQVAARHRHGHLTLTPEARHALAGYRWPGNVRELANVLERAVVLAGNDTITTAELPDNVIAPANTESISRSDSLKDLERQQVRRALAESPTLEEAAARLGINTSTLWRKRKRWGLE